MNESVDQWMNRAIHVHMDVSMNEFGNGPTQRYNTHQHIHRVIC